MDFRVRFILELTSQHSARDGRSDFERLGDTPRHSLCPGVENQLGTVGTQQHPALNAHGVWHHEDGLVTASGRDHRERDTGVATGGLHDRAAWL